MFGQLSDVVDNVYGIDAALALETCQHLLNDISSHVLIAEAGGTVIGFVSLAVR